MEAATHGRSQSGATRLGTGATVSRWPRATASMRTACGGRPFHGRRRPEARPAAGSRRCVARRRRRPGGSRPRSPPCCRSASAAAHPVTDLAGAQLAGHAATGRRQRPQRVSRPGAGRLVVDGADGERANATSRPGEVGRAGSPLPRPPPSARSSAAPSSSPSAPSVTRTSRARGPNVVASRRRSAPASRSAPGRSVPFCSRSGTISASKRSIASRVAGRLIGNRRLVPRSKKSASKRVLGGSASMRARTRSRSAESPGSPTLRERSTRNRTLPGGPLGGPGRRRAENGQRASVAEPTGATATRASSAGRRAPPDRAASRRSPRRCGSRPARWRCRRPPRAARERRRCRRRRRRRGADATSAGGGRRSVAAGNRTRKRPFAASGRTREAIAHDEGRGGRARRHVRRCAAGAAGAWCSRRRARWPASRRGRRSRRGRSPRRAHRRSPGRRRRCASARRRAPRRRPARSRRGAPGRAEPRSRRPPRPARGHGAGHLHQRQRPARVDGDLLRRGRGRRRRRRGLGGAERQRGEGQGERGELHRRPRESLREALARQVDLGALGARAVGLHGADIGEARRHPLADQPRRRAPGRSCATNAPPGASSRSARQSASSTRAADRA